MERAVFVCNAVDVFDLAALRDKFQPHGGNLRVEVEVRHPDREMDGSCRWCGCRENEVVVFDGPRT